MSWLRPSLLALALLGAVHPAPAAPVQGDAQLEARETARRRVTLDVREGWARVATATGTSRVVAGAAVELGAPFHLELGARSSASLRVPGELQLDLGGSTALELVPSGSVRRWTFHRVGVAELDQRVPRDTIHLPRGQVLFPERCALRLEGRVGGATWLEVRAGLPCELDLGGRYTFPVPPGFRRTVPDRLTADPATYRGQPTR